MNKEDEEIKEIKKMRENLKKEIDDFAQGDEIITREIGIIVLEKQNAKKGSQRKIITKVSKDFPFHDLLGILEFVKHQTIQNMPNFACAREKNRDYIG